MKDFLSKLLLYSILLIGLSMMLYPSFSDWWNSYHSSQAIASYSEQVANLDQDKYSEIWADARAYNQSLLSRPNSFILSEEQAAEYDRLLNIGGNGVMGYIEIPTLDITLPIYHGTDEGVLQIAIGHLEWTSLPVGGVSTHSVISGHRGLPSARLFTDLDQLIEGDLFLLRILDEVLTYEVDQIRIVEPHKIQELLIQEGEDLCTLVTCTPYGINSHRLLVRGHRVQNAEEEKIIRVTADAMQIEPIIIAPILAAPLLLILLIILIVPKRKKYRR